MSDVAIYLGEIQIYFGKEYKDEELAFMRGRLFKSEHPREVFIRALKDIEKIDSVFLPPPKDILAIADKAAHELAPKVQPSNQTPDASKRQFEAARTIRRMMFEGKHTRQQILDQIRKANDMKPGTGWMECGSDLEKYYDRCKLPLNETPANFISREL